MNLAADPVNTPAPKFEDLGISTINELDKDASLWTPAIRVGRPIDVAHGSTLDHIFEKNTAVGDAVSAKSDYNYKTGLKLGGKIRNFSAKRIQGVKHLWTRLLLVQKCQTAKH